MSPKPTGIEQLDAAIATAWANIFQSSWATRFTNERVRKDKKIYALYLTQVYHYAYHTPRVLALAGANFSNTDIHLMQHCFEHALEETGHELMALHDLKALGAGYCETTLPKMLPATEAMIGYVKCLATSDTPYRVLGYSYWIERPYRYILSFMEQLEKEMELTKSQLTFYYNHLHIDQKHGADIEQILLRVCQTEAQWTAIVEASVKSMQLMAGMLQEIISAYEQLDSSATHFSAIQSIQ